MLQLSGEGYFLKVVFMGTPEFAVPSLEHLILDQYQVEAVYTQPDRAGGRSRAIISSPVKRAAVDWGVLIMQPVNFREAGAVAQLAGFQPDVIVVAAFGQILPRSVLDIPARGCINIHPSLLPKFRGASPVTGAILAGEEFTGVSIMLMDEGLDTGPVLVQAQTPISAEDTTESLTAKLSLIAARLLVDVLPRWVAGELNSRAQDGAKASHTVMLFKRDGEIDWHLPAVDIRRKVRALQPWPGCYTGWQGKQLKIIEAVVIQGRKRAEVGQVMGLNEDGSFFEVNTGEGSLGVLRVQLEGKKSMSAAEFVRGHKQLLGTIFPSS